MLDLHFKLYQMQTIFLRSLDLLRVTFFYLIFIYMNSIYLLNSLEKAKLISFYYYFLFSFISLHPFQILHTFFSPLTTVKIGTISTLFFPFSFLSLFGDQITHIIFSLQKLHLFAVHRHWFVTPPKKLQPQILLFHSI